MLAQSNWTTERGVRPAGENFDFGDNDDDDDDTG